MPARTVVAALLDLAMQRVIPDPCRACSDKRATSASKQNSKKHFDTLAPAGWSLREHQIAGITQRVQDVTAERLVIPFRQARPEVLPPGFTIAERPPELFGGLLAFKSNFSAQQGPSSGVTEFRTTKTRAVSY